MSAREETVIADINKNGTPINMFSKKIFSFDLRDKKLFVFNTSYQKINIIIQNIIIQ